MKRPPIAAGSPARTYVRAPVGAQRPVGVPWYARGDYLLLALSGRRPAGVSGRPAHPIRSGPITCLADHSGRLRWPASRPVRRARRDAVHDSVWNALPARLLRDPHLRWGGGWAGLPDSTTSHDLRHHCASVLLLQGESVGAVAERLGHHDASLVWSTYGLLMPDSEDRTRRAVDTAWSTCAPPMPQPHSVASDEGERLRVRR